MRVSGSIKRNTTAILWGNLRGKVVFVLGALAYLQVLPLGGSRDEKWRAQWIRKCSVAWNLPKLSQLWWCNGGFGPCTAQNHLRTKQFVSGTWNSSRVAACVLRNEEAGRGHRPRLSSVYEKRFLGALRSQQIARAGNCRCRSVSPSVDMLPFGVTIPATVPQGSEIPEGLMNNPVYIYVYSTNILPIMIISSTYENQNLLS